MNRNKNGVPCCPDCESTHNYFVSETKENNKIIMVRLCHPCQEHFQCIFEMGKGKKYENALTRNS